MPGSPASSAPDREPPLRVWLTVPLVVLVLVTGAVIGWLELRGGREAVGDAAGQLRAEVLLRVRQTLDAYLDVPVALNALNAEALRRGLLDPNDPRNVQRYFSAVIEANPSVAYSFFGTPEGEFYGARRLGPEKVQIVRAGAETGGDSRNFAVTASGDAGELENVYKNFDPRARPWYKAGVAAGGPVWTPIYRHFALGVPTVSACLPAYAPDGTLRGVFGADYPLTRIHEFLRTIKVGRHGEVYLLERSGALVAASSLETSRILVQRPDGSFDRLTAADAGDSMLSAVVAHLRAAPGGLDGIAGPVLAQVRGGDGEGYYLLAESFGDGRGIDWLLVAAAPASDFMSRIEAGLRQSFFAGLLALLAAAAAGVFMARRVARPAERLAAAADALSRGQWDLSLPRPRGREMLRLAQAFGRMAGQLRQAINDLTRQHDVIAAANKTLEARVARRTAELTHMHNRLRAIFDAIPGFVHVVDRELRVVDVGDNLLRAMDLKRDDVLGHKCHEAFHGLDAACPDCPLGEVDVTGVRVRASNPGEEALLGMPFLAYSAPILDSRGEVWGHIECLMDVSRLREAERQLEAAKEAAEEANRAKSDFLAKMSHDIRTPLSSIIGLTDISLQSRVPPDIRDNLANVLEAARGLLDLVNELLDFSRAEAKSLTLRDEDFFLRGLLAAVVRSFAPQAASKGLRLRLLPDRACPAVVRGDPARLRQVLANLVGNAVKFTEKGGVTLRVRPAAPPEGGEGEPGWLLFTVSDTGPGIPVEALPSIFEPYRQGSGEITARFGGSGLGLAICRQMAELMGGSVTVESTPGAGSVFAFRAPLPAGDKARARPASPSARSLDALRQGQRPMSLLLAEDNPMNVRLARVLFGRLGHRLTVAGSGREAMRLLSAAPFDAVLMDVEMPEMDGLEATRRIRAGEAGEGRRDVPIVALTAHALSAFRERSREAGVDAFVTKPVDFGELADVLRAIAGRQDLGTADPPEPVRRAEALARLDDDRDLYDELCRIFLAECPEYGKRLEAALAGDDMAELGQAAHSIKNSCGAIGADSCRMLADEVAALAASGDRDGLRRAVATLCGELERAVASLASPGR